MKKMIIILMVTAVLAMSQTFAENSLLNPGFEDPGGTATGINLWAMWPEDIGLVYRENDALAHGGDDFVELAFPPNTWGVLFQETGNEAPVTAGNEYTVGAYFRLPTGASAVNAIMKVEWYANAGEPYDAVISDPDQNFVVDSEEWTLIYVTVTAPEGANFGKMVFVAAQDPIYIDDAFLCEGTNPCGATTASNPSPANNSFVDPELYDDDLIWTNPQPVETGATITSDVWYNIDDPNMANGGKKILSNSPDVTVNIVNNDEFTGSNKLDPVVLGHDYYWRVDSYETGTAGTTLTEGTVWTFTTINTPPFAEAGFNQNAWLDGGSVTVDLNPQYNDDVDNYPGPLTAVMSSTGGTFDTAPGEDPNNITFTAPGTYTLTLVADDGELTGSDSFDITVYAEDTAEDYLVAQYTFDTDTLNKAPLTLGTHDGTAVGDAVITTADAQVGTGALLLDGTDDFVYIADSAHPTDPNVITWADFGSPGQSEEVTVSAWFKPAAWSTNYIQIVAKGYPGGYRITRGDYDGVIFVADGMPWDGGTVWGNDAYDETDGNWHHVVGVWDGGRVALYEDGDLQYHLPQPHGTLLTKIDPALDQVMRLTIGANDGADSSQHFNGMIDEVRIYNVGLSEAEVIKLFAAQGGSGACGLTYIPADLSQDCVVNIEDFAMFASVWLDCTDITGLGCP